MTDGSSPPASPTRGTVSVKNRLKVADRLDKSATDWRGLSHICDRQVPVDGHAREAQVTDRARQEGRQTLIPPAAEEARASALGTDHRQAAQLPPNTDTAAKFRTARNQAFTARAQVTGVAMAA